MGLVNGFLIFSSMNDFKSDLLVRRLISVKHTLIIAELDS